MEDYLMLLLVADFYSLHPSIQKKVSFELYKHVYPSVVYILHDDAEVEDIVQEVFIKVINSPPIVENENQLRAWLKVVARNTALNFVKKNKIYRNYIDLDTVFINTEDVNSEQGSLERNVEAKVLEEDIIIYLKKIKPDYQQLIELKWKRQLSYKEIADEINTSENIVRQKLHRAREALRKLLHKKWGAGE
ncbi:RNA polymerase sigma factor [Paenibacillus elgii]|uniref:RNA polymerase sigma factor n=1 Tax=Paenibacillus elgii TaxID=189691 RepID=A0A163TD58_9BACL|nr:sigma-70 family RNA polymerase sigma factor [Paenibacillus elgii]KZE71605.1 RNA polymerase subunit sigma-24 [Paenibacillus elgii]NEN84069.1 sigma-70 family RNA polymerase sigma factor [Paenibacillus elgii]